MTAPRHIHLDMLGGIAGDMFAAAMLDAVPSSRSGLSEALSADGLASLAKVTWSDASNGGMAGVHFSVKPLHAGGRDHDHRSYRDVLNILAGLPLGDTVRDRAQAIFTLLADAEAAVHGVDRADVVFHEVGAVDSIIDIVAGAWLIEAVAPCTWSSSPVPLGSGRIRTDHGPLPVPAPATALLLKDMPTFVDGIAGERVTPTGAALLRNLNPSFDGPAAVMALNATGHGLGTRQLDGVANLLRVLVFESSVSQGQDEILCCTFEIDDQTPEDLAVGLDRLRAVDGVVDVLQMSAIGKHGRQCTHIQILATPGRLEPVAEAIFQETTTLGLRWQRMARRVLARNIVGTDGAGTSVAVKLVKRPDGVTTAKAEMGDLVDTPGGHEGRRVARAKAEGLARNGEGGRNG